MSQLNKVFLNADGIIEIHVVGDQTVETVQAMGDKATALIAKLLKNGQRVLIIDNLLSMGQVPPEARKRVVALGKSLEYDRLAMLGSGHMLRLGANLILSAVGKGGDVHYFEDYESAVAWLKK